LYFVETKIYNVFNIINVFLINLTHKCIYCQFKSSEQSKKKIILTSNFWMVV